MTEKLRGVSLIFDLDGTLVDTAPDLVRALNAVIEPEGLSPVPLETVRHMVGRGARRLIDRAYAEQGVDLAGESLETHTARFLEVYRDGIDVESRPFDDVAETLEHLRTAGARLSVATNKPTDLSALLLGKLKLADFFERIVGADTAPGKKPDAAHLRAAAGPDASRLVMIGDSVTDVEAARNAQAPVILTAYGYTEIPVQDLGADAVVTRFRETPQAISALL